jgi:predicted secreted hydrolase
MRRRVLAAAGAWSALASTPQALRTALAADAAGAPVRYPPVLPGTALAFPRDFGAHPEFRTEWWYITGWLRDAQREFGVQITFFRSRTGHDPRNPSRFAPTQLLLAHAALALPEDGRLRHDQRAARAGFGFANASEADTDVAIGRWRLRRDGDDRYHALIPGDGFELDLRFAPRGAPFPQGDAGYSRKGPRPEQASCYYSRPQLAVQGSVRLQSGPASTVGGVAWLDHEWSSELLDAAATGWDWIGLNLDDGSAVMAFRVRDRSGAALWSHARWAGSARAADNVRFEPMRQWRSARSGASYPSAMRVSVDERRFELLPLFDDQELDTRASTGTIYWEGAVRVLEAGRPVGRGYLELTGYAGALRL